MTKLSTRKALLAQRKKAHSEELEGNLPAMAKWLLAQLDTSKILASYKPIGSERDPGPLTKLLNIQLTFPKVMGSAQPLSFFSASKVDDFERGAFGVMEPKDLLTEILPDIVIAPLVGFDENGYRMGYGGGFYDRTLAKLRAVKSVTAIGYAYEKQLSKNPLNFEPTDLALDFVMTPSNLYKFNSGKDKFTWS
ncbi:MAG: 5-formyltetrahydrofolate cyclo-ligase [Alphaproteobacteria bacterium]